MCSMYGNNLASNLLFYNQFVSGNLRFMLLSKQFQPVLQFRKFCPGCNLETKVSLIQAQLWALDKVLKKYATCKRDSSGYKKRTLSLFLKVGTKSRHATHEVHGL